MSANINPLPKTKPLMSVKTDIIMKHVDDLVCDAIDSKCSVSTIRRFTVVAIPRWRQAS